VWACEHSHYGAWCATGLVDILVGSEQLGRGYTYTPPFWWAGLTYPAYFYGYPTGLYMRNLHTAHATFTHGRDGTGWTAPRLPSDAGGRTTRAYADGFPLPLPTTFAGDATYTTYLTRLTFYYPASCSWNGRSTRDDSPRPAPRVATGLAEPVLHGSDWNVRETFSLHTTTTPHLRTLGYARTTLYPPQPFAYPLYRALGLSPRCSTTLPLQGTAYPTTTRFTLHTAHPTLRCLLAFYARTGRTPHTHRVLGRRRRTFCAASLHSGLQRTPLPIRVEPRVWFPGHVVPVGRFTTHHCVATTQSLDATYLPTPGINVTTFHW